MTDTDKIKRMAEGFTRPETTLALIAEVEGLKSDMNAARYERDYAVALLRRYRRDPPSEALEDITDAFLAALDGAAQ